MCLLAGVDSRFWSLTTTRWMETVDPTRPPIDLLRPYPVEKIGSWAVDERVGNVSNDDPKLLTDRPTQPLLF